MPSMEMRLTVVCNQMILKVIWPYQIKNNEEYLENLMFEEIIEGKMSRRRTLIC